MFFNDYGKVIIAFYLFVAVDGVGTTAFDTEENDEYEGKLRIAQYDTANIGTGSEGNFEYYKEQNKYFGQASAIAFGDWGPTEVDSEVYLGGAADNNRYKTTDASEPMEWGPIIYHLKSDLTKLELWKIKI